MPISAEYNTNTINQLALLFKNRQINLEPGFQRKSVWTGADRRRLIESVFAGYPIPSIFLYRRDANGRTVYDVIDGKQRLESLFMFAGIGRFAKQAFDVKLVLGDGLELANWLDLRRRHPQTRAAFDSYRIQTVEVRGELNEIVDLFVRINSTGKRLTSGEKRHARYYRSRFLIEADRLVKKCRNYLLATKILTAVQIDRMKATELFAELLMSINAGEAINKKTALDRALGNDSVNGNTLARLCREFTATMNSVKKMFPHLAQTRFRNSVEFYTLFMLVWEMQSQRLVLGDRKKNAIAFELLKALSVGVDELRVHLRKAKPARPAQRIFSEYLLTVQGDTDSASTRQRRREILKNLVWPIFDRKDPARGFSVEQRRLFWHRDEAPKCARCGRRLSWDDFTIDHIKAWSRGGPTSAMNAQLMHRRCNSAKGAR
jgi:hypothetical protein